MKIISKIEIICIEHEDVTYWRWSDDDWRVEISEGDIIQLTEECEWLEELFQTANRKERLKCLDDLDVMRELGG